MRVFGRRFIFRVVRSNTMGWFPYGVLFGIVGPSRKEVNNDSSTG